MEGNLPLELVLRHFRFCQPEINLEISFRYGIIYCCTKKYREVCEIIPQQFPVFNMSSRCFINSELPHIHIYVFSKTLDQGELLMITGYAL